MKSFLFLLIFAVLNVNAAQKVPTYKLNSAEIDMGKLAQANEGTSHAKFYIQRTATSPEKIKMFFNFDEYYQYCSAYDYQQVWIPAQSYEECHTHEGHTYCSTTYVPGHYETREVCVAYDYAPSGEVESLKLDFKKANDLSSKETEKFLVELKQKNFTGESFDIIITPVQTKTSYEIKRKKFLFWKTFGFKFKAK